MTQKVINDFLQYMRENGGRWIDWYVGVTDNPRTRLFTDHAVQEAGVWIHSPNMVNDTSSRAVEKYFLDLGCDGGGGGGSTSSTFVYAYKRTAYTNENN